MASSNPYAQLIIDRAMMIPTVAGLGGSDITYQAIGNTMQLSFHLEGKPFKMAVYENKGGKTTLTYLLGQDRDVYETVAAAIKTSCAVGAASGAPAKGSRGFEVSIHKVPREKADQLMDFLASVSEKGPCEESPGKYSLSRYKGHQGDVLTIKRYTNGTLQLQGKHGVLAENARDFLANVLQYEQAVQLQMDTFEVPFKIEQIKNELASAIPLAHDKLGQVVRAQFASALALTKVNIPLEDYGAIAFPALRGLEGFMYERLGGLGFKVPKREAFHEYFEQGKVAQQFVMKPDAAAKAGEPCATRLSNCYNLYYKQRHGIFHMDADPETSRMPQLDDARSLVKQVFDAVEGYHK